VLLELEFKTKRKMLRGSGSFYFVILAFCLLVFNTKVFAQDTEIKSRELDSLKAILVSGKHDSIICHALFNIIELQNGEKEWEPYNKKLDELVQKNLKLAKDDKTKKLFLTYQTMVISNYGGLAVRDGEYEKAILLYEKGLKISKENKFNKMTAILLNGMGLTYKTKGDFVKALEYYKASLKLRQETGTKSEIARALNNISGIYQKTGNQLEATRCLEECIKIREAEGDQKGLAVSLNNLAQIYLENGKIPQAMELHNKSLRLREITGDQKGLSVSLNNIAQIYIQQGEYERALENYTKSLKIREKLKDKKSISNSLYSIGLVYDLLKMHEKAAGYYQKSFEISEATGDMEGMARAYNTMAVRFSEKKDLVSALKYHFKALELRIKMNDKKEISISHRNIAAVYFKQNKLEISKEHGFKSLKLAQELGNPSLVFVTAELLSNIHRKQQNYSEALAMYELFIQMRDSTKNNETKKALIKSQLKYEYEKQAAADSVVRANESLIKNVQLQKQNAELKVKRNQQTGLFVGLGLVLLFSAFMFNRYKITKKQQEIIQIQKTEVESQKLLVDEKQRELLDSIHYAKRIQNAHLPSEMYVIKNLERLKKG